jgi:hypothetical protein
MLIMNSDGNSGFEIVDNGMFHKFLLFVYFTMGGCYRTS